MNFKSLLPLLMIFGQHAIGQLAPDFEKYKEEYPNSQSVRLNQETVLKIGLEDGKFTISQESLEEDLYFYENAKFDAKQSLSYSSFFELDKIEASSFVIKNDKYEELKVSDFREKDDLDGSFYDDVKSVNFIFPGLGEGAKTKLKYKQTIKNPRFLNAFYFANFYPIENNTFTIVADKKINLRFQEVNMDGVSVEFTEKNTRKQNIYTWQIKKIDEYKFEQKAPNYKSILPHIIPIIESYETNGETIDLLRDVDDLYKWYYSLIENLNSDPPAPELVQLVDELTTNKANELEKVRAIYYWVQENVKYIAFEYALGGFVPREANDVFRKKYGDCKDNSNLLLKMLEIADIKSNLTWIGTRSIPYRYEEVPTPSVDNHMILHYEHNGQSYYLDATGRFNPIELPTSFIQGKEALVSMGPDSFSIKEVPVIEASKNLHKEITTLKLDGNDLVGSSTSELNGYGKIDFFYRLEKKERETELLEVYNAIFQKGNNSFQISNFTETDKFEYDKPFILDYDFTVPNYAKKLGDEIYINLNLKRNISNLKTEDDRTIPLEHDYMDSIMYQYEFEIPEGYTIDYLPEGIAVSNPYFDNSISYLNDGNKIVYKQHFKLKTLLFDVEAQKIVNDAAEKIEQQYKEVVVLKKQ